MPDLSDRLKALMRARGVVQTDVSAGTGISQPSITRYLQGRQPKAQELRLLADFFGVSMDWLFIGDDPKSPAPSLREDEGSTLYQTGSQKTKVDEIARRLDAIISEMETLRSDLKNQQN